MRFLCLLLVVGCGARPDPGFASGDAAVPDAAAPDATPPPLPPPKPPPDPGSVFSTPVKISIGPVTPGAVYDFVIPPNAVAFNVVVQGGALSTDASVDRLVAPSGNVVLDKATPTGGNHSVTVGTNGMAAAECPQTDAKGVIPIETGTWSAMFDGPMNAKLHASVVVQVTDDGKNHGGVLDLHVYVPDGISYTPSDIEDRLHAYFERVSLHTAVGRGTVTQHRIASSFRTIDDATELIEAFEQSKVVTDGTQALHVILAETIAYAPGKQAWGIASGIPGAATRTGTQESGVALAFLGARPEEDAEALEHETGHFFGLSHTTEFEGGYTDPLDDTPWCSDMNDPASCPDRTDVMFPTLIESPELTQFSLAQATIFSTNPVVRMYRNGAHTSGKSIHVPQPQPTSAVARSFRCVGGVLLKGE